MKKVHCIITQVLLLVWFFLDMTGVYFGEKCLVTKSFKDDGIFFIIYLIAVLLFIIKEKIGKWFVIIWSAIWFIIQFLCHEWYTIFNSGFMGTLQGKINYFSGTMQWLKIDGKYIPDIYHTILHILILLVLAVTSVYTFKNKKSGSSYK